MDSDMFNFHAIHAIGEERGFLSRKQTLLVLCMVVGAINHNPNSLTRTYLPLGITKSG